MFQSSPARGGGCNTTHQVGRDESRFRFNPHPPVGAGATPTTTVGRVIGGRFQSSPARGGGCNPTNSFDATLRPLQFQSSPARGGGCNHTVVFTVRDENGFQSSPARGGGCNVSALGGVEMHAHVSILTRPWGRVQRAHTAHPAARHAVSILTRPWGRVQPDTGDNQHRRVDVSILTRPWGRVQPGKRALHRATVTL